MVKCQTALASWLAGAKEGMMEKHVALSNATVHWGYFSKLLEPVERMKSGEVITMEMATHQACDDWDLMIAGDAGMESLFMSNPVPKFDSRVVRLIILVSETQKIYFSVFF